MGGRLLRKQTAETILLNHLVIDKGYTVRTAKILISLAQRLMSGGVVHTKTTQAKGIYIHDVGNLNQAWGDMIKHAKWGKTWIKRARNISTMSLLQAKIIVKKLKSVPVSSGIHGPMNSATMKTADKLLNLSVKRRKSGEIVLFTYLIKKGYRMSDIKPLLKLVEDYQNQKPVNLMNIPPRINFYDIKNLAIAWAMAFSHDPAKKCKLSGIDYGFALLMVKYPEKKSNEMPIKGPVVHPAVKQLLRRFIMEAIPSKVRSR